jgi:hypothetical protein
MASKSPKTLAREAAQKLLEDRIKSIRSQLRSNRLSMARLAIHSTVLKREIAELGALLKTLLPKEKEK